MPYKNIEDKRKNHRECRKKFQENPELYKAKQRLANKRFYDKFKERGIRQKTDKTRYQRYRSRILEAYGAWCSCCGENEREFLSIDHINGDGKKHREKVGFQGSIYADIIRQGFPKDKYRILCMNCNWARGLHGYCPHEKKFLELVPKAS